MIKWFGLWLLPGMVQATGLYWQDENPFTVALGMPYGPVWAEQASRWQVQLIAGNTLQSYADNNETALWDGENTRLALAWRKRLAENWAIGVEAAFNSVNKGAFDHFIEDYHDVMGLPQGERLIEPVQRLRFYYEKDGEVLFDLANASSHLGDAWLQAGYRLPAMLCWGGVKIPLGKAADLSGNEAMAATLGCEQTLRRGSWAYSLGAAAYGYAPGELLSEQQQDWAGLLDGSLRWFYSEDFSLVGQLRAHSALWRDTDVPWLQEAVVLGMGGNLRFDSGVLEVVVTEDVQVSHSPDVTLGISYIINN